VDKLPTTRVRFDWLNAFRAVMQTGTVTGAASTVFRTQPQVSRMIANLEDSLGLELFKREGRRLIPTEQALELLQYIEPLMLGLDAIPNTAQDIHGRHGRRLVIAAEPFVLHALVPEVLEGLGRESELKFAVDLCVRGLGLWMSYGSAELGVVALPFSRTDMNQVAFAEAEMVVAIPPTHPLASRDVIGMADLVGERFIALLPGTLLRAQIDIAAARDGVHISPVIETSSGVAACELVSRGYGITISDPLVAASFGASRVVMKRMSTALQLTYGFLVQDDIAPPVRQLMDAFACTAKRLGGSFVKLKRPGGQPEPDYLRVAGSARLM